MTQFTPEQQAMLDAPSAPVTVVVARTKSQVDAIVRTADGRVFNLGKPSSLLFPIRRWIYLWHRRHELKGV